MQTNGSYTFNFTILDVAGLLNLEVRHRGGKSIDVDCPLCGKKGKMNLNMEKNVFRCNYCNEFGGMIALYGKVMNTVTITFTAASHMTNFEKLLTSFTYTMDADKFTITIEHNSAEDLLIKNSGTSTIQFKAFDIVYE